MSFMKSKLAYQLVFGTNAVIFALRGVDALRVGDNDCWCSFGLAVAAVVVAWEGPPAPKATGDDANSSEQRSSARRRRAGALIFAVGAVVFAALSVSFLRAGDNSWACTFWAAVGFAFWAAWSGRPRSKAKDSEGASSELRNQ